MVKIDTKYSVIEYDDSDEMKNKVFARVIEYFKENCRSGEGIYQSDSSQINALELVSDLADKVIKFKEVWKDD